MPGKPFQEIALDLCSHAAHTVDCFTDCHLLGQHPHSCLPIILPYSPSKQWKGRSYCKVYEEIATYLLDWEIP